MAPDATPMLPEGAFDGRVAFELALRGALDAAARSGWSELVLSDPTFVDWPLGERSTLAALQNWAGAGRRFVMLAQRFDVFQRDHPRFVEWRRLWSHIVDCRLCNAAGAPPVPSALLTPTWYLHRIDVERVRGICGTDPARRVALRESIDECVRQGRPGFPSSTLGL